MTLPNRCFCLLLHHKFLLASRCSVVFLLLCSAIELNAVLPPPDGGYPGDNTAEGTDALFSLTGGLENTAIGADALHNNTGGIGNTAVGHSTLVSNTSGADNTAIGVLALFSNTDGSHNTASGDYALYSNTDGADNTANGHFALYHNTTGPRNTSTGHGALYNNTTGQANTASGYNSLLHNTVGSRNIALGSSAGMNLTTGSGNIDIGNQGTRGESGTIRIGTSETHKNAYIAGINGVTVAGGVGVIVDSTGHLGTVTSSARYKEDIQPIEDDSRSILGLQPVKFTYKKELDPRRIPQFGLVAEDVAKVDPDLVARDEEGKPYTVRYEAVNAMLLNEFIKEHRKVEEQARAIATLQDKLTSQGETLARIAKKLDESGR